MNKAIGGYFELELPQGKEYHQKAVRLNTGRNAFEYILRAKKYIKVYLPYFTCDVMLEPIKRNDISYEFYNIDLNLEPLFDYSKIEPNAAFLYTNYFALKDKFIAHLKTSCKNLIIDNAQSFYSEPLRGINTFYSPRKFFGVPDGAYLYTDIKLEGILDKDISLHRFEHLLGRIDLGAEICYPFFKENEALIDRQPIKIMSNLTQSILKSIDYKDVATKRQQNFQRLHQVLKSTNQLKIPVNSDIVPMLYPYLCENGFEIRKRLIENKVFIPTYWLNVLHWDAKESSYEKYLTTNLIPLPIHQRISESDLSRMINYLF